MVNDAHAHYVCAQDARLSALEEGVPAFGDESETGESESDREDCEQQAASRRSHARRSQGGCGLSALGWIAGLLVVCLCGIGGYSMGLSAGGGLPETAGNGVAGTPDPLDYPRDSDGPPPRDSVEGAAQAQSQTASQSPDRGPGPIYGLELAAPVEACPDRALGAVPVEEPAQGDRPDSTANTSDEESASGWSDSFKWMRPSKATWKKLVAVMALPCLALACCYGWSAWGQAGEAQRSAVDTEEDSRQAWEEKVQERQRQQEKQRLVKVQQFTDQWQRVGRQTVEDAFHQMKPLSEKECEARKVTEFAKRHEAFATKPCEYMMMSDAFLAAQQTAEMRAKAARMEDELLWELEHELSEKGPNFKNSDSGELGLAPTETADLRKQAVSDGQEAALQKHCGENWQRCKKEYGAQWGPGSSSSCKDAHVGAMTPRNGDI